MPSNFHSIDSNFPTFTGKESPEQQIRILHNYLFQLREGLRYSLQNLTAENFNPTALQSLTDEQKNQVAVQLQQVYAAFGGLSGDISRLAGQVADIKNLAGSVSDAIFAEGGLAGRLETAEQEVQKISGMVQRTADGGIGIGAEDMPLHLVGRIFINGVLYE